MMARLEIIVDTFADALLAEAAGATQLDLKADFPKGGVTPSIGLIEHVCGKLTIPVMVMVRPHARGFLMNEDDLEIMCSDIRLARNVGARHFLLGCLNDANSIDQRAFHAFRDAAGDGCLHFHLAWELTDDRMQALDDLAALGVKSVRTTGGGGLSGKVELNLAEVRRFNDHAKGRIDIFLAGGIHAGNIERLIDATGIANIHVGSGARIPATPDGIVDGEKVRLIRESIDRTVHNLGKDDKNK